MFLTNNHYTRQIVLNSASQQIGIEVEFLRIIRMIFCYTEAANKAVFEEKILPSKYKGVHKVHGCTA